MRRGMRACAGALAAGAIVVAATLSPTRLSAAPAVNRLVSHAAGLLTAGFNSGADGFVMSGDGRYIAFRSNATNLIDPFSDNTGPGGSSIFLYDRSNESVRLVNHVPGDPSTTGNGFAQGPNISADGRYVVYESAADDLVTGFVDNNDTGLDLYLYDVASNTNTLISHSHTGPLEGSDERTVQFGGIAVISAKGTHVAYRSEAPDIVPNFDDENGALEPDVYLFDIATGNNVLVSHDLDEPLKGSLEPIALRPFSISGDGRYVTYLADGESLTGITDANGGDPDVLLYDRTTGGNRLVTHRFDNTGVGSDGDNMNARLSTNGKRIVFESQASNLVKDLQDPNGAGTNATWDVYVHDTAKDRTRLVSFAKGTPQTTGNAGSFNGARAFISDNGKTIAYESAASDITNFTSTNFGQDDLFLWTERMKNGKTVYRNKLITEDVEFPGFGQPGIPDLWGLSGDGSRVLFSTGSAHRVVKGTQFPLPPGSGGQMFLWRADKGRSSLASRSVTPPGPGFTVRSSDGTVSGPVEAIRMITSTGDAVVYSSTSSDLIASFDDNNAGQYDLYWYGP